MAFHRKTGRCALLIGWFCLLFFLIQDAGGVLDLCKGNVTSSDNVTCCECEAGAGGDGQSVVDIPSRTCVEQCPNGTYAVPAGETALPDGCHVTTTTTRPPDNSTTEVSDGSLPMSDVWCKACDAACALCNDSSNQNCAQCAEGYVRDSAGACVWTSPPLAGWIIPVGVVLGVVGVAVLAVVIFCVVRRCRRGPKPPKARPPAISDLDMAGRAPYENVDRVKTLSVDIERRHDDMTRYKRDPTVKVARTSRSLRKSISSFIQKRREGAAAGTPADGVYEDMGPTENPVQPSAVEDVYELEDQEEEESVQPAIVEPEAPSDGDAIYENAPTTQKPVRAKVRSKSERPRKQNKKPSGKAVTMPRSRDESEDEDQTEYENEAVIARLRQRHLAGGVRPAATPSGAQEDHGPEDGAEEDPIYHNDPTVQETGPVMGWQSDDREEPEVEEEDQIYGNEEIIASHRNVSIYPPDQDSDGVDNPTFHVDSDDVTDETHGLGVDDPMYSNYDAIQKHSSRRPKK